MIDINYHDSTITLFGDCAIHISCKGIRHNSALGLTNWLSVISETSDNFDIITDSVLKVLNLSDYAKRVLLLNSTKKIFDYLFEKKSDFFVFDCADCRKQLLVEQTSQDLHARYLTLDDAIEKALTNGSVSLPSGIQIKACYEIDINEYYKAADLICSKILQYYSPDHIVFVQRRPSDYYYNSEGIHEIGRTRPDLNKKSVAVIEMVEKHVIDLLSKKGKIKVIYFPDNVLADPLHFFGLHPYHYCSIYYEYVKKAVDYILKISSDLVFIFLNDLYLYFSLKLQRFKDGIVNKRILANNLEFNNFLINYIGNCLPYVSTDNFLLFNSLKSISDINNYLDLLYLLRFSLTIIVSVKDTCGFYSDNITIMRLRRLGFKSYPSKFQNVYLGIIINNMSFLDLSGAPCDFLEYKSSLLGKDFYIASSSFLNGNTSIIEIDSVNYSLNDRGLNIVVIHSETLTVIDSISYDSHLMDYLKHKNI